MSDDQSTRQAALDYHEFPKPGKLEIRPTKPMANGRDLSLAYSPGVAEACLDPAQLHVTHDVDEAVVELHLAEDPLGLQLIGKPWEEGELLNTAYALETAAGFVEKPGRWW